LQLAEIRYKPDSSGKLKIMSKEEMLKRGIKSPDVADALSLTFYDPPLPGFTKEDKMFYQKMKQKQKKQGENYKLKMV
jgi:hypothetical protein